MTTFSEMVTGVIDQLQGFTAAPDQATSLKLPIDANATTLTVDDPNMLSRGFIQIEDEILWVSSVDQATGQVTIAPYGRGYRGTTKAAHAAGVEVTYSPVWTRNAVKREINNQVSAVYPTLYAVKAAPIFNWPGGFTYQFALPADAERVVDVRFKFTAVNGWQRATAWESEHSGPSDFAGGRFVSIYTDIPPGSQVQVLYACRPAPMVNGTDDFSAVTGLADGIRDVIELGVMAKLARFMDTARLSVQTVEADQLDQPRQLGSATNVANDLFRQYQIRLSAEQQALSTRYPARKHRTR